jgi:hypothetical protein
MASFDPFRETTGFLDDLEEDDLAQADAALFNPWATPPPTTTTATTANLIDLS